MVADLKALERQLAYARTLEARMDALSALAWALREVDVHRALTLSQQLLRLAQTVPQDAKPWADAHRCLAGANYGLGHMSEALRHALESLKYVERCNDRYGLMQTRVILGNCYLVLGDYPAAQILYRQAVMVAEDYGDDAEIGRIYKNIGVVMSLQGEYEEAIACYDRALPYAEKIKDEVQLAKIYNNYSVEYTKLMMLKEAAYWAKRAYDAFYRLGRRGGLVNASINLAHIYAKSGNLQRAREHMATCLHHAEQGQIAYEMMLARQNSGEIAFMAGEYEICLEEYHQALTIAQQLQTRDILFQCHEGLYKAYKALGDSTQALYHHEEFHRHRDMVFNETNSAKWQNLEILHRTREARQEAHRQRALREADRHYFERLTSMKDDFINSASHDLKNPLAMMKTSLYLLKRHGRLDDETGHKHLTMLDNQVNWMRDLITNILDLAWLEMGRAIQTEMVEVVGYLGQIMAEHEPIAQAKGLVLKFETSLDSFETAIDGVQVRQVLANLISNAIKYTPSGGQVVVTLASEDDLIKLGVCDTGYGIPESALPHIFERFYRVQEERHQKEEGTGLGLSIVKSIVEQHGGTIDVQSKPEEGTCFFVHIPIIPLSELSNETLDFM